MDGASRSVVQLDELKPTDLFPNKSADTHHARSCF